MKNRWMMAGPGWLMAVLGSSAAIAGDASDLYDLSLQDLLSLEVESFSRTAESAWGVAASVYVLTSEDIQRSGATRLQDVLELVPGSWFADHSYDQSSSTVREEAVPYSGSVWVLLDGVPIWSHVTGGFVYSLFDLDLGSIERIEVIRGPGGTMYGANAATGVISLYSRKGANAEPLSASVNVGNGGYRATTVRTSIDGDAGRIMAWAKYKRHDGYDRNEAFDGNTVFVKSPESGELVEVPNRLDFDAANQEIGTFGLDWEGKGTGPLTWSGSLYWLNAAGTRIVVTPLEWPTEPGTPTPESFRTYREARDRFQINARSDYHFSSDHDGFLRAFVQDERWNTAIGGQHSVHNWTVDLEAQDNLHYGAHRLSFGANGRFVGFDLGSYADRATIRYLDPKNSEWLYGAFAQDQFSLHPRADLTLGVKAETWTLLDDKPEISPSLRLAVRPHADVTLWSALTRSVTTAGYGQSNVEIRLEQIPPDWYWQSIGVPAEQIPAGAGDWVTLIAAPGMKPTEYRTAELGARAVLNPSLTGEASTFFTRKRDGIAAVYIDAGRVVPSRVRPGEMIVPVYFSNTTKGESWGGEEILRWSVSRSLRLEFSHAWYRSSLRGQRIPGTNEVAQVSTPESPLTPEHALRSRCYLDLPRQWRLSIYGLWSTETGSVQPYDYLAQKDATEEGGGVIAEERDTPFVLDVQAEKRWFGDRLSVSAWGRNLLNDPYVEAYDPYAYQVYPRTTNRTWGVSLSAHGK